MAMWDKLFSRKKDEDSGRLNPIVQSRPMPAAAPRVSHAKPAPLPVPVRQEPPAAPERDTKSRKKKSDGGRPTDDAALVKRGLARQAQGDHDGAIDDFTKAIDLNPNLAQAFASRGVSREAKGDHDGAKGDYSKSIQIEIMGEINRQIRENPDVEM